jgi:hypothetical protein
MKNPAPVSQAACVKPARLTCTDGSVPASVFRTRAWVQAWIDQWGQHPCVQLIDVGGSGDPLEYVYRTHTRIKKFLPVTSLCLAGVGFGPVSAPRAEYNDVTQLLERSGDYSSLSRLLGALGWQQLVLPDVCRDTESDLQMLAQAANCYLAVQKREPAYSVDSPSLDDWLSGLGPNTRLAYYNRRGRLQEYGCLHFYDYSLAECDQFFAQLNEFHCKRWGQPCYSAESRKFMANFGERLSRYFSMLFGEADVTTSSRGSLKIAFPKSRWVRCIWDMVLRPPSHLARSMTLWRAKASTRTIKKKSPIGVSTSAHWFWLADI